MSERSKGVISTKCGISFCIGSLMGGDIEYHVPEWIPIMLGLFSTRRKFRRFLKIVSSEPTWRGEVGVYRLEWEVCYMRYKPKFSIKKEASGHGKDDFRRHLIGISLTRIECFLERIPKSSHSIIFLEHPPVICKYPWNEDEGKSNQLWGSISELVKKAAVTGWPISST